jgi:magnesium transporter
VNEVAARINCTVYRKGVKLEEIRIEDISVALEDDDTFVWLGLFEPDKELMDMVQDEFDLHDLAVSMARTCSSCCTRCRWWSRGSTLARRTCLSGRAS